MSVCTYVCNDEPMYAHFTNKTGNQFLDKSALSVTHSAVCALNVTQELLSTHTKKKQEYAIRRFSIYSI